MATWCEREARRNARNLLIVNLPFTAVTIWAVGDILWGMFTREAPLGAIFPALLIAGLAALGLWNCKRGWTWWNKPDETRIWGTVSNYGDPTQLSSQIEAELSDAARFGQLRLTRTWLVRRSFFSGWVGRLADTVWVYRTVTQTRVNGVRTGKNHAVAIHLRNGAYTTIKASRKQADRLLAEMQQRAPWAIFGFSQQLQTQWKNDLNGMVAAVDSRARQLRQHPPAASTHA